MNIRNLSVLLPLVLAGCVSQRIYVKVQDKQSDHDGKPLGEGIPAYDQSGYVYKQGGKKAFKITFGQPVIVAVADKDYGWGFFQFPSFYTSDKGSIVARWSMAHDNAASYGKGGSGCAVSIDKGKTWKLIERGPIGGGLRLKNNEFIGISTPPAIPLKDLQLRKPVAVVKEAYGRTFRFWKVDQLPDTLQGVYIHRRSAGDKKWVTEHAKIHEADMVRYADNNLFPIVWWGDMKLEKNGSVVAGVYPGFTFRNGTVPPSDIPFYRSDDGGRNWSLIGRIPYSYDPVKDPKGGQRKALGFTEPAFEILKDGSFVCVMRTTDGLGNSPMYISRSSDRGADWSKPAAFTKNGVLPQLRQLDNGVLVLVSGRPGVQVRIALKQDGSAWSDPFEMLPWVKEAKGSPVSCGYTDILPIAKNKFLLIYSDFKYKTGSGKIRKAIKVREITVSPY